tara:strand:- start:107 stop:1087 length:981 start_codon:yes stop_codon:yes gene_type:complete
MVSSTASSVFAEYCFEADASFGQGGSLSKPIQFGKEVKITGLSYKNNQMPLGQLYSPEIETFAYGKSEGKCSAEYVLSNPWFFKSVLGTPPAPVNSGGLYAYTWSSTPTSSNYMKNIHSMALRLGFDIDDDYKRTALGVVCPSLSIKMALNETIKVTQELVWGSETVNQTMGTSQGVPLAGAIPYTFVHASVTSPLTGSTLATVQSIDLDIASNAELIYQMGQSDSVDAYRKILELTGKISLVLKSSAFLESVYSRATTGHDLVITISNGGSGLALRSIVMTLTGCSFSSHNTNGIEPGELLLEDVDFQCKTITVVAKNQKTTFPA